MNDIIAERTTVPEVPVDDDGWTWAIVEIMGFRKHAGRIREVEQFGAKMLRVDVPVLAYAPVADSELAPILVASPTIERWETHLYGGSAIFGITPTSEDVVMKANRPPEPYHRYLPRPGTPADALEERDDDDLDEIAGEGEV